MAEPPVALLELIAQESAASVPPAIAAVAETARARHGPGIVAMLFYGSCLRDGEAEDRIVDLYLLADSYGHVHRRRIARVLNALLPPNVYYVEAPFAGRVVRAKYAILSLEQLERLVRPATLQPYFWARFAQPAVVAWTRDDAVRGRVVRALAVAATTLLGETRPLVAPGCTARELWSRAFAESYRTELRAETPERSVRLHDAYPERYRRIAALVPEGAEGAATAAPENRRSAARRWRRRRVLGKLLSVLRLIKAAFTFEDGATYLVWKIERHSGVRLELTPWQRRHPVLASSVLAWRLYRAGGFR